MVNRLAASLLTLVMVLVTVAVAPGVAAGPPPDPPDLPGPSQALDWWDAGWANRLSLLVDAGTVARSDAIFEVPVDFGAALARLGRTGSFDPASIRVVESDGAGEVIDPDVPFQFDPAADFDPATNAAGTIIGILTGPTPANISRSYDVYFDVVGAATTPAVVAPQVVVTDGVMDEGQASLRVQTANATWYYQKDAGGFSSLVDADGHDWIGYSGAAGSAGAFRGIPNAVFPAGHFHPGATSSTTTLVATGPLRATFESTTTDGWAVRWKVYPRHATLEILAAPSEYWVLYEGTPGGAVDVATDRIIYADGTIRPITADRTVDMADPEWAAFADPVVGRSLFLVDDDGGTETDRYYLMNSEMTVFGFGRGSGTTSLLTGPNRFTFGLTDGSTHGAIGPAVENAWRKVTLTFTALEYPPLPPDGPAQPGHALTANSAGQQVLVGIQDGALYTRRFEPGAGWLPLVEHGLRTWAAGDVALQPDGTVHLIGVKQDGRLYTRHEDAGGWSDWTLHGLATWQAGRAPAIASSAGGTVLAAVKADGRLYTRTWDGTWGGWTMHGLATWSAADVAVREDGEVHLVAVKHDGRLFTRVRPGAGAWAAFVQHGLPSWTTDRSPAIGVVGPGVAISAVKADGRLFTRVWEGQWGTWVGHGLPTWASTAIAGHADGSLTLMGTKHDGRLYSRTFDGAGWLGWVPHGLPTWADGPNPSVAFRSGEPVLLAVKSDGRLYTRPVAAETDPWTQHGTPGWRR